MTGQCFLILVRGRQKVPIKRGPDFEKNQLEKEFVYFQSVGCKSAPLDFAKTLTDRLGKSGSETSTPEFDL